MDAEKENISLTGLINIGNNFKNIHTLNVDRNKIGNLGCQVIAQAFNKLQTLYIRKDWRT